MPSKQIVIYTSRDCDETKTIYDGSNLNWTTSDKIGIYSAQARKTSTASAGVNNEVLTSQNNGKTAYFKGNLYWGLNTNHVFYAYYPHNSTAAHPNTAVPISLPSVQFQGTNPTEHLSATDFMVSDPLTISKPGATEVIASVPLMFNHLFSIIEFKVKSSVPKTIKSIRISTTSTPLSLTSGYINITQPKPLSNASYVLTSPVYQNSAKVKITNSLNLSSDEISTPSAYLMILPADLSSTSITIEITDSENNNYKLTKTGKNFLRSKKYRVVLNFDEFVKEVLPAGISNCYILKPNTYLTIPINIKGNGNSEVMGDVSSITHVAHNAIVSWSSTDLTVSQFNAGAQTVRIYATKLGNATIAAFDPSYKIIWTWHIWVTDYDPNIPSGSITFTPENSSSPITIMNRNLGAILTNPSQSESSDANNLFYQWGRKDPYSLTSLSNNTSINRTITYTIENPLRFITDPTGIKTDWCTSQNKFLWIGEGGDLFKPGRKTIFDPCPHGWRVLHYVNGNNPYKVGIFNSTYSSAGDKSFLDMKNPPLGIVPLVGVITPSDATLTGFQQVSRIHTANHHETLDNSYSIYLSSSNTMAFQNTNKLIGMSVRCVKDEY